MRSVVHTLGDTRASRLLGYGLGGGYLLLLLLYLVLFQWGNLVVVALLIGLYLLRHIVVVMHRRGFQVLVAMSPILELALLLHLFLRNGTEIENIVLVLFVADLLLYYKSWYALPFAFLGFGGYLLLWRTESIIAWQHLFDLLSYSCLVLAIWSAKRLLNQREMNRRLNEALAQEARMREEVAVLQERTRIAEEMHDTVGHTLTTAIVALEGAGLLVDARPEEAQRKIQTAREQLKQGLGGIRQVVRALKAGEEMASDGLQERLERLLQDAVRQTDVRMTLSYEVQAELLSLQEYVIIHAVKEAVTNALKHGEASEIAVRIAAAHDLLVLTVEDDGGGSQEVVYGFGLQTMKERAEAIGGRLRVRNGPDGGFIVELRLPVAREERT